MSDPKRRAVNDVLRAPARENVFTVTRTTTEQEMNAYLQKIRQRNLQPSPRYSIDTGLLDDPTPAPPDMGSLLRRLREEGMK